LCAHSVWASVEALYADPITRARVSAVYQAGWRWPAMAAGDRSKIESSLRSAGLALAWSEEELPAGLLPPSDAHLN
jgi:hypothetical protein